MVEFHSFYYTLCEEPHPYCETCYHLVLFDRSILCVGRVGTRLSTINLPCSGHWWFCQTLLMFPSFPCQRVLLYPFVCVCIRLILIILVGLCWTFLHFCILFEKVELDCIENVSTQLCNVVFSVLSSFATNSEHMIIFLSFFFCFFFSLFACFYFHLHWAYLWSYKMIKILS